MSVLNTIKRENISFDLIHCHGIFPDGLVAIKVGRYFKKKVVLHVHDSYIIDNSKLNKTSEKIMTCVDKLLPVSRFQMQQIGKISSELLKKSEVVYNGVKITQIDNSRKITAKEKKKIVFVGNMHYVKGVDILLKALYYLNDYNYSLDIIGNGEKAEEYKEISRKHKLEDKVKFLGEIPNNILLQKLIEYDLLVLPSRYETFGIVLIEAMSCGLPVVSTKVGAAQEIITSGDVGILVEPENPESLAKGITEAFNKTWDKDKIKEYANKFSIHNTVEKIESVYGELIGN